MTGQTREIEMQEVFGKLTPLAQERLLRFAQASATVEQYVAELGSQSENTTQGRKS